MRTFGAALLASALIVSSAYAAPLAPGKPAGVKKAQADNTSTVMLVAGLAVVGLGIGLVASSNSSGNPAVTSTATATQIPGNP